MTDNDSHEELDSYLSRITEFLDLSYCFIKTNSREMFYEDELGYLTTKHVGRKNEDGWWSTIAHSLSMIASVLPWMWNRQISTIYLGSTYANVERSYDANNDSVLHALNGGFCKIEMADNNLPRNEKVAKIVQWKKTSHAPIQLKVCWQRTAGKNCSSCEKCYRTILNIISNHGDPRDFGFALNDETLGNIRKYIQTHHVDKSFWKQIQQAFLDEKAYWVTKSEIAWILTIRVNPFKSLFARVWRRFFKQSNFKD